MSNTALITPTVATEDQARVEAIFAQVKEQMGFVPDGLKLYSISPPLLESFLGTVGYFRGHPTFRQELLAMIRYLASSKNNCTFCIDFNESILLHLGLELDDIRNSRENPDQAPLPDHENVLLTLALNALNTPDAINTEDVRKAKASGWDERAIFEAVLMAANNQAFTTVLKTFNIHHQGELG